MEGLASESRGMVFGWRTSLHELPCETMLHNRQHCVTFGMLRAVVRDGWSNRIEVCLCNSMDFLFVARFKYLVILIGGSTANQTAGVWTRRLGAAARGYCILTTTSSLQPLMQ